MREITISTRALRKLLWGGVGVGLLLALAVFGRPAMSWLTRWLHAATPTPSADPAMLAAIEGAEAFFTIRAEEGAEGWAERMCSIVNDDATCQVYRQMFVPMLVQPLLEAYPDLDITLTVEEATLVAVENNGRDRIYRLTGTIHGWPEDTSPLGYVQVHLGDDGEWRFVRPLFQEEAERYQHPVQ